HICRVGNIMIDALEMSRPQIEGRQFACSLGIEGEPYGVVTLHRPSNVDDPNAMRTLAEMLQVCSSQLPLVFPVHPRTRTKLVEFQLWQHLTASGSIRLIEPVPYIDFMSLIFGCAVAITDSGGIQEETTYLRIPCITLRETTERPITVTQGTNSLM